MLPNSVAQPGRRLGLQAAAAWAWPFTLGGCAVWPGADHAGAHAPQALPLRRAPRVAWVLGSGGPRGFVHVGVLKALHELGLKPDLIVGASVGAMVGTLCAGGIAMPTLEALALELQPLAVARLAVGEQARYSGSALADFIRWHLSSQPGSGAPVRLLEDLPVAMACVAVRQRDSSVVAFTAGDAGVAVQASAAMAGQFTPVRIRGELHIDPDGVAPLPVRVARALGAQRVLAVDASAHEHSAPAAALRFKTSDLRKRALIAPDAQAADLVLHPEFGYWVSFTREFRERAIAAGYRDTLARAAEVLALHGA